MTKSAIQLFSVLLIGSLMAVGGYTQDANSTLLDNTGEDPLSSELRKSDDTIAPAAEVVFGRDLLSIFYPDIPTYFHPSIITYTVSDGVSGEWLQSPEAQAIAKQLALYAGYYQAPWYFKNFTVLLENKLNFSVKYFATQGQFQEMLVNLTGDPSLRTRSDFITIHEADGNVVLYMYAVADPIRMQQLLKRQGFIQFATIALPTLPVLLRDGFALYFEDLDTSSDIKAIIRNRTYYKNITYIPALYQEASHDDVLSGEFILSDDQLYAWLMINYLYSAYDFKATSLDNISWEFQYFLMELTYEYDDNASLLNVIQQNNRLLAERIGYFFDNAMQQKLTEHLKQTMNHHQAYLAGIEAFQNYDLTKAKALFMESAFSLREYYQPRYAIARIALYQIEELMASKQKLQEQLSNATDLEKSGYQMEIQVVTTQINDLTQEARHYLNEARVLIEYFLAYNNTLSASNRQELEEFRGRIANFYNNNTMLSPYNQSETMPDDGVRDR